MIWYSYFASFGMLGLLSSNFISFAVLDEWLLHGIASKVGCIYNVPAIVF